MRGKDGMGGGISASVIMKDIRCLAELEMCHRGNVTCRRCSCEVLDVKRDSNKRFRTRHADRAKRKKTYGSNKRATVTL